VVHVIGADLSLPAVISAMGSKRGWRAYISFCNEVMLPNMAGWPPFEHESIEHELLTALEQWKTSRHRSLWLVVSN